MTAADIAQANAEAQFPTGPQQPTLGVGKWLTDLKTTLQAHGFTVSTGSQHSNHSVLVGHTLFAKFNGNDIRITCDITDERGVYLRVTALAGDETLMSYRVSLATAAQQSDMTMDQLATRLGCNDRIPLIAGFLHEAACKRFAH